MVDTTPRIQALDAEATLAAIDDLVPTISARAREVETARRLPSDLLAQLVDAGCFRLLLPTSHGGGGADLLQATRATETLARADGSVGWTTMIGSTTWCDLVHLPPATFRELFASPDAIVAGVINPSGTIEAAGDDYRVSGRWGFATGVEHATWIAANCVEAMTPDGPELRLAVLTPTDIAIEDTWRAAGLRGTGSHHFHAEEAMVPAAMTLDPFDGEPCIDEPIARIPVPTLLPLRIAAAATGIALGALDDIMALAEHKVPLFAPGPLASDTTFHHDLATADADLRAARALLTEAVESTWDTAVAGATLTPEARARARIDAVWIAERAADVVRRAYRAGGGTSPYDDCPLQRRLRDIQTLSQHFLVRPDVTAAGGSVLAGFDPPGPVF